MVTNWSVVLTDWVWVELLQFPYLYFYLYLQFFRRGFIFQMYLVLYWIALQWQREALKGCQQGEREGGSLLVRRWDLLFQTPRLQWLSTTAPDTSLTFTNTTITDSNTSTCRNCTSPLLKNQLFEIIASLYLSSANRNVSFYYCLCIVNGDVHFPPVSRLWGCSKGPSESFISDPSPIIVYACH